MSFYTYQDAVESLMDYLGGGPTDAVVRDCRRAVLAAYRDLANAFRWKYLLAYGSVPLVAGTPGYPLPAGFIALDRPRLDERSAGLDYVAAGDWPAMVVGAATGSPARYTIVGDPDRPGRLMLLLGPTPDVDGALSFVYHRRPRPLAVALEDRGRLSAGSDSIFLGVGTAFTPGLVGSILRVSAVAGQAPTGPVGKNPAFLETEIASVEGPTGMTTLDPTPVDVVSASYTISDPIDIEEGSMLTAFLRGCEHQVAGSRTLKEQPSATRRYQEALAAAKGADSRSYATRSVGDDLLVRPRAWRQVPDDI